MARLTMGAIATAWNGWGSVMGTVTVHSWDGDAADEDEPRTGVNVDPLLNPEPEKTDDFLELSDDGYL